MSVIRTAMRSLVAVALVGAVALPTTAYAARSSHNDARRDAVVINLRDPQETQRPAPRHQGADIVRTHVRYTDDQLVVRTRLRDLPVRGINGTVVAIRTPDGSEYRAELTKTPGQRRIDWSGGDGSACTGLRARYQPRRDRVTISVPASCFGAPDLVRVGVGQIHLRSASAARIFVDDARLDGGPVPFDHPKYGPRIRRS